ncbi:MAG: GTPase Era, partial [Gammaproteobacteria bacterium]
MSPNQDRCGRIVVVGRANTGKSTLINALIGQNLHIATARAQTTRYVTSSPLTLGASQFVFIDTPGIYRRQRLQHRQFNRSALSEISSADIVLAVFDGLRFDADDRYLVEKCSECPNALALINKIDTVSNKNRLLPHIELLADTAVFKEVIPISALRGINLDRLIELVEALLPKQSHLMDADALSNRGAVFFIAETIREQALSIYRQEIPHDLRIRVEQA